MTGFWEKVVAAAGIGAITLGLTLSITVLLIYGSKTERVKTEREVIAKAVVGPAEVELSYSSSTDKQVHEGSNVPVQNSSDPAASPTIAPSPTPKLTSHEDSPYVGGNYTAGRSTIRYIINDNQGQIEMYGHDIMRNRTVSVGTGRMVGRELIIPKFYSFLDNIYGTLKLELSEDGKTFEGRFEGFDPTKEGRVVLSRLP